MKCRFCVGIGCELCNVTGIDQVKPLAQYVLLGADIIDKERRFKMVPDDIKELVYEEMGYE